MTSYVKKEAERLKEQEVLRAQKAQERKEFMAKLVDTREYRDPNFSLKILSGMRLVRGEGGEKNDFWFTLRQFPPAFKRVWKDGKLIVATDSDDTEPKTEKTERFLMETVRSANSVVCGIIAVRNDRERPNDWQPEVPTDTVIGCLRRLNSSCGTCLVLDRSGDRAETVITDYVDAVEEIVGDSGTKTEVSLRGLRVYVFPVITPQYRPEPTPDELYLSENAVQQALYGRDGSFDTDKPTLGSIRPDLEGLTAPYEFKETYEYQTELFPELTCEALVRLYTTTEYRAQRLVKDDTDTSKRQKIEPVEQRTMKFICLAPPAHNMNAAYTDRTRPVDYSVRVFPSKISGSPDFTTRRERLDVGRSSFMVPF